MIKELKKDYQLQVSLLACVLLAACHWIQFIRSGYMIQPVVHAGCATMAALMILLSGRKFCAECLFVWAMAILYYNRFNNYTSLCMILVACGLKPKFKKVYIVSYVIGVFVSLVLYHDSFTHLGIHGIGFLFCFSVYKYVTKLYTRLRKRLESLVIENIQLKKELENFRNKDLKKFPLLVLESDEKKILEELIAGKEIKEIELYSQNTIYTKLRAARDRNNCVNNDELVTRYKANL